MEECSGGYFSETSLRSRIPPATPRDPVIPIKPQAPKARSLIRIPVLECPVKNKEQSLSPEPRVNGECWDTVSIYRPPNQDILLRECREHFPRLRNPQFSVSGKRSMQQPSQTVHVAIPLSRQEAPQKISANKTTPLKALDRSRPWISFAGNFINHLSQDSLLSPSVTHSIPMFWGKW